MPKTVFDKKRYIECALEILNIGMWRLTLEETDEEIEDHEDSSGVCATNTIYRYSDIVIRADIEDEDTIRSVLLHEVLHIPHAQIDYIVQERIINDAFGTKFKRVRRLNKDYIEALEPFIVLLTAALRPFVDSAYDKAIKSTKKVTKPNV